RIEEGAAAALGLDGSRTFDTTVVAWAARRADGTIDVDANVFSVRKDAPHHVFHEGGRIDFEDVEQFTLERFEVLDVREAAYDPRYLERSVEIIDKRLPDKAVIAVEPHSAPMREALQTLDRLTRERRIRHRGDPVIAAHFANATVERGDRGEIRRVRKLDRNRPIDAVPALALAVWRAEVGALGPRRRNTLQWAGAG
ncbi:MAG TPA: terminase TerL endonuclease subunit, partial [Gaiellaceae bacterium]|nr:terminase TerL endonuclease subunit [Gaiellaceae bacterium]